MDRGEKIRKPRNRFEGSYFNRGRKDHRAEDCKSATMKIKKTGDAAADKKNRGRGKCYVGESEEHFAHKQCGLCRSLEHRTRDREERGAEKGALLAQINMPANFEVGLVAATIGAAREDDKEEWDSDSGTSFYMSYTPAVTTVYKKAPPGTSVEDTDGTSLPVDGFGEVEVDLDQPGTTTSHIHQL